MTQLLGAFALLGGPLLAVAAWFWIISSDERTDRVRRWLESHRR